MAIGPRLAIMEGGFRAFCPAITRPDHRRDPAVRPQSTLKYSIPEPAAPPTTVSVVAVVRVMMDESVQPLGALFPNTV